MGHRVRWINAGILMAATLAQPAMGEDNAPIPPLDWMAGHWCSGSGAKSVEEVWLPPRGVEAVIRLEFSACEASASNNAEAIVLSYLY
jgi:hypothetical protein